MQDLIGWGVFAVLVVDYDEISFYRLNKKIQRRARLFGLNGLWSAGRGKWQMCTIGEMDSRTLNTLINFSAFYHPKISLSPPSLQNASTGSISYVPPSIFISFVLCRSQLFGLVKLSHRHVFKVGELERSQSTHTAFLRRSVKIITRGKRIIISEFRL